MEVLEDQRKICFEVFLWLLLLFALATTIASFWFDWQHGNNLNLFGRSGAVMVAMGTYFELSASKTGWPVRVAPYIASWVPNIDVSTLTKVDEVFAHPQFDRFLRISRFTQKVGWAWIILGTAIWAYGA